MKKSDWSAFGQLMAFILGLVLVLFVIYSLVDVWIIDSNLDKATQRIEKLEENNFSVGHSIDYKYCIINAVGERTCQ